MSRSINWAEWKYRLLLIFLLFGYYSNAAIPTTSNSLVAFDEDLTYTFISTDFPFTDDVHAFKSVNIISAPSKGTLLYNSNPIVVFPIEISVSDITGNLLKYTPFANENGDAYATFSFSVIDTNDEESASVTMVIDVDAVNDAPTAASSTITLDEDNTVTLNSGNFQFDDIDVGDTFSKIEVLTSVAVGSLENNGSAVGNNEEVLISSINNNDLKFTPALNGNGDLYAFFTFRVFDNNGGNSGEFTITFKVNSINDLPTSINTDFDVTEDIPKSFSSDNFPFTDVDGGVFTKIRISDLDITGSLQLSSIDVINNQEIEIAALPNLEFIPLSNENGPGYASFDFEVHDGADYSASTYKLTINVAAVNDPPTINTVIDPSEIYEDAIEQTINVGGISGGINEPAPSVTATSNNTALIPTPLISFDNSTGIAEVKYTPVANQSGTAIITVTVFDGTTIINESWNVSVIEVNDQPTIDAVVDQSTNEDQSLQVDLTGISAGANETGQTITFTAVSDNPLVVPDGIVTYSGGTTGFITFNPITNALGIANITLTLTDDGGTSVTGDINTNSITFKLSVVSANDPPTLNDITSPIAIDEDANQQSIGLAGINDGDPEVVQPLTVSASSDNLSLIETVITEYTNPNSTATLKYTPKPNAYGTADITVTVSDGDKDVQKLFTVTVNSVNDLPTLNSISDPVSINEGALEQTVNLLGISPGPNEASQSVSITASSNLPLIIPDPTVLFTQGNTTGSIKYTPLANQYGTVIITITVTDDDTNQKSVTQTFSQVVNPINNPPTINSIGDISLNEDLELQTLAFSGVTDDGIPPKNLTITATSSDIAIIPHPTVNYTSPNESGSIEFKSNTNRFGIVNITIKVTDKEALFVEETFEINVINVNDPPQLNDIPVQSAIIEDAGPQSIDLTGISAGSFENEIVQIYASSDNTTLIENPTVNFDGSTGNLLFTTKNNASGTAIITVQVDDEQGLNNIIEKSVEIIVLAVNDAPTFQIIGNQAVSENSGAVSIAAFATNMDDGDIEDQTLTFQTSLSAPTGNLLFDIPPSIDPSSGELTFKPSPNTNGNVTVNVVLRDNGGTDNGGINQNSESFIIYVTAVNEPPIFTLDGNPPEINEDAGPTTESDFASFIDDGDPEVTQNLIFNINQTSGSLTFDDFPSINPNNGLLSYTTASNSNGTATFNVQLEETATSKVSTTSQFTITVNAVNDPPVGDNGSVSLNEDATHTFSSSDFDFSDIDNHAFDGIQIASIPLLGELKYNGTEVTVGPSYADVTLLTFTPGPGENGDGYTYFTFKVQDESGDNSISSYMMNIDVLSISDDPTGASSFINTPEETEYSFLENDFPYDDTDGDAFAGIIIETNVTKGKLFEGSTEISGTNITITDITNLKFLPDPAENGTPYTDFTFNVLDATGASSVNDGPYTMVINVGATNDRPTGSDESITMLEDQVYLFQTTDFTFNDDDGDTFEGIQITEVESLGILKYDGADAVALVEYPDITKLTYTPPANQNGIALATFKFKVRDNSGSLNLSSDSYTMTINVTAVNDAPIFTITENPPVINEDAGAQSILSFISTIDDGDPEASQTLTFNTSFNAPLPPTLSFSSDPSIDAGTGTLSYTSAPNSYGTTTINVSLSDNGGTSDGGIAISGIQQFTITVNPINDEPIFDDITGPFVVNEDAESFNVDLTGISAGPNETQTISVEATSSDINIIPNPVVSYTSPDAAGQLTVSPVPNAHGVVSITVKVMDGQATDNTISKVFQVTVNEVNDPPTLSIINNPTPINEGDGLQTINLAGISAGTNESQLLEVIVTSNNTALIPTPSVNYTSPDAIGSISYTPVANMSGIAEISVIVQDDGSNNNTIERKFSVEVLSVNDPPTLDDLPSLPIVINEDQELQTLILSGITAGGSESQPLTISAVSDLPEVLPNPTISAISDGEATLSYMPNPNKNGLVTITITVDDGQALNNTVSKSFTVDIRPVNDFPTLSPITGSPFNINEDALVQSVTLSGISAGGGETQTLSIFASSNNVALIPDPSIIYVQGDNSAQLSYTPVAHKSGQATITVYVDDLAGINNLKSETFVVNVAEINDFPTINDIISPGSIPEDATQQIVSLSGITAGGGETQTVTVTAKSLHPTIIGDPTVNYSGNNNASLLFTPLANANGTATIEVTVDDDQSINNQVKKSFSVSVLKVNDLPTLDIIPTPYSISEDAGIQTIVLSGISQGPNESEQSLSITAVSDNTTLIPAPTINPKTSDTRDLVFTPVANKNGVANITVTVNDGQSSNNIVSRVFVVNVSPQNDMPSFELKPDINITENSGLNTLNEYAFNIDDGDPELSQGLNFDLTISGSLSFKTNPTLSAANGNLEFETSSNSNGQATILVKLNDTGSPPASSTEKTFKINVLPLNGKPSFTLNGDPPSIIEDAGPIVVSNFAPIIDDGDPDLTQTLSFSLNKINGDLNFTADPQINSANGNLTYETALNSAGSALMSVILTDDGGETSSTQFFTITATPVDDAPVGSIETISVAEDVPYSFKTLDFTYSDVENDAFNGIQIVTIPTLGVLEYDGQPVILNQLCPNVTLLVYKSALNGNGSNYTNFDFKLRDSQSTLSVAYKMTINVTPVDDNPSTAPAEVNTNENVAKIFSKSDFPFNDPDGDSFVAIKIHSLETRGDLEYNLTDVSIGDEVTDFSKLVFKPVLSENGTPYSTFEFQVKDSKGSYSLENTMSINVGSSNDPPTGGNKIVSTLEDVNYIFSTADFTFNDVDGHLFDGIRIESLVTNGNLEYNGNDITNLPTLCPDVTKLVFKPAANGNGSPYASFTFKVKDNSSTSNLSSSNYKITINVPSVNDPPIFTFTGNPTAIDEDASTQTISNFISSINDGDPDAIQNLQFSPLVNTGTTGSLSFSTPPTIDLLGTLNYRPTANTNGTATFTFNLTDDGGTTNGGINQSQSQSITITVNNINDFPTINPIADRPAILEDAGTQSVNLTNVTAGPLENQTISISAVSSNTSLIPNPVVNYTSPNAFGSISYTPALNQSGTSTITIEVNDGSTPNGILIETFLVIVNPVNDPPTMNDILDPNPILENSGEQIVSLSGITAGGGENQEVLLSVVSSNSSLIPTPVLSYLGGTTAQLAYTPTVNQNGLSMITVKVDDQNGGIIEKSFKVTVSTVNDPPQLDAIANPAPILEDATEQQISLTGISPGTNEIQDVSISAESSNTNLISDISIKYTNPSSSGILSYTTNANQFGTTIITVTVDDGSLINNLISQQFTVEVLPVTDMPLVTNASTNQGVQSTEGLLVQRNENDGEEVTYFNITNIQNGTLYLQNGQTEIIDGEFVSFEQANIGFRFTPNSNLDGSFDVQASLDDSPVGLGGEIATAIIYINSKPTTTGLQDLSLDEDSPQIIFDLYDLFDDAEDADMDLLFEVNNTSPEVVDANISNQTLAISFIENQFGIAYITVKCTDTKGAFVEAESILTVNSVNDLPEFETDPILTGDQDVEYQYQIITSDVEGDDRYFNLIAPEWLTIIDNGDGTAALVGTPGVEDNGDHNIEVIIVESANNISNSQSFVLNINNINDPPFFANEPETQIMETEKFEYLIEISDPDANDSYTVSLDPASELYWLVLTKEAPYKLEGFAPEGSEGSYPITLYAIDKGGLTAEQNFVIEVSSKNNKPVLTKLEPINLDEDESYKFKMEMFSDAFSDEDPNDSLVFITIVELPMNGTLTINDQAIQVSDTIFSNEINNLVFTPDSDFSGFNFFNWNASDGKSLAQSPSRVSFTITSIDDAPEIIYLETDAINYEFGDYNVSITETVEVKEVDDGRIASAMISITSNYLDSQDSLSIGEIDGISSDWNDTTGVLTISGIKSSMIYEDILRSLIYTNQKRFAPNTNKRTIELVVSDGELQSIPVYRDIEFTDTFVELEIPSGFTPNQDGVNDTWEIDNILHHEDAYVNIYSREGILIFESYGNYKPWDGSYNGSILKSGVYYYTIEIVKFERKYSGNITILR